MPRTLPQTARAAWQRRLILCAAICALVIWMPARAASPATRVVDINTHQTNPPPAPNESSTPQHLLAIGNTLYFTADNGSSGRELWKSNGTAGNASQVKNINPGNAASDPAELTEFGGELFFTADNGMGQSIWKSDGTSGGTALLTDTAVFSSAVELTRSGSALYFSAASPTSGRELWKTDGTSNGTLLVKNIAAGASSANPTALTDVNGMLFFAAAATTGDAELWKTNGTPGSTQLVKDINPGLLGQPGSAPTELTNVNGTLFFAADNGSDGAELWKSDGTITGTLEVKDINSSFPGASSAPTNLTVAGNTLFFTANDGLHGIELWKSDGTPGGTILLRDIYAGALDSSAGNLTNVGGTLYFTANDGVSGVELWKSDGTPAGTVQVKDIYLGAPDSSPAGLVNIGGTLLFAANDGTNGIELWKSRGTPETTQLVQNIASGAGDSHPTGFTILGTTVFFSANDDTTGSELWSIPLQPNGLNFAPVAANTTISTAINTPLSGTLPASDPDNGALTFTLLSTGTKGTATLNDPTTGAFTYTPNNGATGVDSFTFKVNDGRADSNLGTITVTINASNRHPVAENASIATPYDVQYSGVLGGSDPDSSPITFSIVANGAKGVARITNTATGAFTYTPNAGASGVDSFMYKVSDGQLDSNVATITVTIGNPKVWLPLIRK